MTSYHARAIGDLDVLDYSPIWPTSVLITLAFLFVLLMKQQEITFKKKLDYLTVSGLVLFAYSFGTVIHINCYYDHSAAEQYTAKVLDKRISSGKSTSYYLKLSTWGPQNEVDDVSVSKALYNRTEVGTEVNIYFRNGILEIPWFIVRNE
ncbi:hypothetical protein [Mangrovibacterium lignilyticum]|uniref:hypothetical protein n=1 Tax=Mangrovibacterium lignilyticum TaxID=2668052 RepID=UPI0013D23AAE|nr:hypothetical protein [Mangrovibacterium lignilyticum]